MKKIIYILFPAIVSISPIFVSGAYDEETISDYYKNVMFCSSQLYEQKLPKDFYAPWKAVDGDLKSAWAAGKSENEYLGIKVGQISRQIRSIEILPGIAASDQLFKENNRPRDIQIVLFFERTDLINKQVAVTYNECKVYNFTMSDENKYQRFPLEGIDACFAKYKESLSMKIFVKSVYTGSKYNDTGISEIKLIDTNGIDLTKEVRDRFSKMKH